MKRIYIAGHMTSYPHYNVRAFEAAAKKWQADGFTVQTPFDANSIVWKRHYDRPFDPYHNTCEYGDPIMAEMFAEDVRVLSESDAIVLLEGWEKSKGANVELAVARLLGKEVLLNATMLPLDKTPAPPASTESVLQEAQRLVHGDRGASYGHPSDDYTATGRIWAAILDRWLATYDLHVCDVGDVAVPFPDIDPRIAALMMVGVKVSREAHKHKRDNLTDAAGYSECVQMIAERQGV